jgi:hypothetical protein
VQQDGTPFLDASGQPVASAQPNSGIYDEDKAFTSFNVAFPDFGTDVSLDNVEVNEFYDPYRPGWVPALPIF